MEHELISIHAQKECLKNNSSTLRNVNKYLTGEVKVYYYDYFAITYPSIPQFHKKFIQLKKNIFFHSCNYNNFISLYLHKKKRRQHETCEQLIFHLIEMIQNKIMA